MARTSSSRIQGDDFAFARVAFAQPVGFRVLDERDLCEFWEHYHEGHGWLYEVEEGGWLELETARSLFNSPSVFPGLREFLIVDDQCISVLTVHPPEIEVLGSDPERTVNSAAPIPDGTKQPGCDAEGDDRVFGI